MTAFEYSTVVETRPHLALIVLQAEETIEDELRRVLPDAVSLNVSRVPSGAQLTTETLAAMEAHLAQAAALFPEGKRYDVAAYACTSATAQLGRARVAELIRMGTRAEHVTEPVTALLAACSSGGIRRLAFLSPYIAAVSGRLRAVLADEGIETPVFGSFEEANERRVARIDAASLIHAARSLVQGAEVDALFCSCTNIRMFPVIPQLQRELHVPILSSNLVLLWHMLHLAGTLPAGTRAWDLLMPETACRTAGTDIF